MRYNIRRSYELSEAVISGHRNLKSFLLLYSKSCFPESEMLKGFTFDILVFIFRNRKT